MAGKKKWIKSAIKHPGRETERAREHGVSVHQQMVTDSHSNDPSLRAAGNLGLSLSAASKKRAARRHHGGHGSTSRLYDNPRSHAKKDD